MHLKRPSIPNRTPCFSPDVYCTRHNARLMSRQRLRIAHVLTLALLLSGAARAAQVRQPATTREFLDTYCVSCHNQKLRTSGLALDNLDANAPEKQPEIWEHVIAKLRAA